MSGMMPGDRVRVAFDGTVNSYNLMTDRYSVEGDGGGKAFVRIGDLAKYDPPVKVGDVISQTPDDFEVAPDGTVVLARDGRVWQRCENGCWYNAGNSGRFDNIDWLVNGEGPLTVLHVGGAA